MFMREIFLDFDLSSVSSNHTFPGGVGVGKPKIAPPPFLSKEDDRWIENKIFSACKKHFSF